MKIVRNSVVSLIYDLREENIDGKLIETLEPERPLTFIYGTGRLLPEFETRISLLQKDDNFSFVLDSGNAYGEKREDMIINVPITVFKKDGKIDEGICRIGNEVPMMDSDGNHVTGKICEIGESYVRMDFNHPMAGINLFFSGRILDVREATENELAGSLNSCSSCGSNKTSCGSGSCN